MEDNTKSFLKRYGIIVIDSIKPEMREFFGTVSKKEIETTMLKTEKRDFLKWLEDYKRR